jgi:hypothetical protein
MYMSTNNTNTALQANAGTTSSPTVCFQLLTCTLSIVVTHPPNALPSNPLLDEIQAVITVNWTSLIGNTASSSSIIYYLTDTRAVPACDNSIAGTC